MEMIKALLICRNEKRKEKTVKKFWAILIFSLLMPCHAVAFDFYGWWQSQNTPSVLMRITEKKIFGFDYTVKSKTDSRVEIFVDNSDIPCYIDRCDKNSIMLTNALGEKEVYKFVTKKTNLNAKEVKDMFNL